MFDLWLCRLCWLAFYARLSPIPLFTLYLQLYFSCITVIWVIQSLVITLQCVPLATLWSAAEGKCMGGKTVLIITSALTIACDLLLLLLPIHIVCSLQMRLVKKLMPMAILCSSVFAVA
ncbi:hypothetical protein BJX63DRAFT_408675, partial [Aspergillus granulosus]